LTGVPDRMAECDPPGSGVQCATIRVPLDWDRPNGRTIRLALAHHLASKPGERIGTLFIDPGGPGDTGVGLVRGDPNGVDAIGGGRFDVVGWDPRGTWGSTRVRCFNSRGSEDRFWARASLPTTTAQAKGTERRGAAVARRCGQISGWLLPHISTADTDRDLDHLRVLMGEKKLTYVGLSYGTYIGDIYASLFPDRVRAMMLDGNIDPVRYAKSAEATIAMFAVPSDEVLAKFLSLCEAAGPKRCALAGGKQSPAKRWGSCARAKRHPIPAPGANGSSLSTPQLSYGDLLISQFQPLRAPSTWPHDAADLAAALRGNGSALENTASLFTSAAGWSSATTSAAIQCADGPAREGPGAWLRVFKRQQRISPHGSGPLRVGVGPCASWPVRAEDAYRGPWNAVTPNPILVINQTHDPNSLYGNAVATQRELGNAVLLTQKRGLRSPLLPASEHLRREGDSRLSDRADHPTEKGRRLPVGPPALRSGFRPAGRTRISLAEPAGKPDGPELRFGRCERPTCRLRSSFARELQEPPGGSARDCSGRAAPAGAGWRLTAPLPGERGSVLA
jgi:pimeloyl-ACP methyl ester carboxylesterase